MTRPEDAARKNIDDALTAAGWAVQDRQVMNLDAAHCVAVREFPLKRGHGFADYLLYVDGEAVGVIEAKEVGTTLTGVEGQTEKYSAGLPDLLPAPDVIAGEIVEDLRSALEQFETVEADLRARASAGSTSP
ncbi:hypothetical protein WMF27_42945 [Sorangium sp. So ce281]|uniref:hypothetical protein n=1 Tax=unclassified Sorangium TaxID=2621164 RepID=UPI003F62D441